MKEAIEALNRRILRQGGNLMIFNFTLSDLNDAFNEYCEDSIKHLDTITEEHKKENFLYIKAIQEFIFFFMDDYLNAYYIDNYTDDLNTTYEKYKTHFSKSYDVKVYGQAWDMSPADPVILKGVIAADADELERKIRQKLKDIKSDIYAMTNYEVINNEHEQET